MALNKIIYTETTTYSDVVAGFNTAAISADGATTLSAQATIDVDVPAAKTFDSGKLAVLVNQGITYTAATRGTAGNSITVRLVNPGTPGAALSVPAVVGTAIIVNLATDGGSAITSTAAEIITALNLVPSVQALIVATGAGATPVTALTTTALATGADPEVNTTDDEITIPSHGLTTGLVGQLTSTGTLPAGLSLATDYYIISVDANTISLASSYANAIAGTAVDITDQGSNGAVNTFTSTAMVGGTVILQKSNDGTNWLNIGSAETFTADEVNIFEEKPPACLYYRLVFGITTGRFDVTVIWVTRGPN